MFGIFKPAPHLPLLPAEQIDDSYKKHRWQIFVGIFVGYAAYYLVRKNFSLAMPFLIEEYGYSKGQLGLALSAVSIAYGLSKFLMGSVSDRSNPRYFLMAGLLVSSGIMFIFGFCDWATQSVASIFILLFINGWAQGMGWPACGRTMVHWYSGNERGTTVSVWNIAHNIGGGLIGPLFIIGMAWFNDWRSAFYLPAAVATFVAGFIYLTVRDTPQSQGLPSIEDYRQDYPKNYDHKHEEELSAKQIFLTYVLNNKLLWYIAVANAFVYLIRYGVLDWAPTYLSEAKDFSINKSSWAYFLYEWAGIPGTLLCGYISDKWFKGRRAPAGILYMVLVLIAVLIYWLNPAGNPAVDIAALMAIGFLIYGPVMLIGLFALELVPKKAAGTAAGLTGLFGYLGGAVVANIALGYTVDHFGWDGGFVLLVGGCIASIILIAMTLKHEIAHERRKQV
ncbi:glycerol-3-phosphate transporter [Paraglaciecola hydrolytica]|uniref:Glycerol-3-phosphate transporter n=1 Tax=Paraglaciecola hydrolytica TaxID=1799789 RepID=A0A136A183_9ALTE|nr:glycerol-3-phosphate transporter [Paraglaciecola hydrolytica]KXI28996.1 glycerol-3-phosphate transporter [Paraglaciecola hydrolytica]